MAKKLAKQSELEYRNAMAKKLAKQTSSRW